MDTNYSKRRNSSAKNAKVGFYSLNGDNRRQVWAISLRGKTIIDPSNVVNFFSRITRIVTKEELGLIPKKNSLVSNNTTFRRKLSGKFLRDPESPITYWYVDTEKLERHPINQIELMDFLFYISSKITKEELDKIANEK